jgi:glycosyltransferase involved in cell wall biosynthesis
MSDRKPRVSVGLPVYNGERYLVESLDSLLAQTFEDFEIVVCDNASTDRTGEIAQLYAVRDPRVRYHRNPQNIGASGNYAVALGLARGHYFRWSTCDDLCAPDYLARALEILDRDPSVVLAYAKTRLIDAEGHVISDYDDNLHLASSRPSERIAHVLERIGLVNAIYGVMRPEVLRRTKLVRPFSGGDYPLMAELALYGRFWEIPEFLFFRRFHPEASSSLKDPQQIQAFFDPQRKRTNILILWRQYCAHFGSIWRAPMRVGEKTLAAWSLARIAIQCRNSLGRELLAALKRHPRTPAHSRPPKQVGRPTAKGDSYKSPGEARR